MTAGHMAAQGFKLMDGGTGGCWWWRTLANRKGNDVDQGIGISSLGTSSTQVWWSLARLCVLKLTDRGAVADYWQAGDWMTTDANHHLGTTRHELGTRCLNKLRAAEMDHWHCGGLCMLLVFT